MYRVCEVKEEEKVLAKETEEAAVRLCSTIHTVPFAHFYYIQLYSRAALKKNTPKK